MKSRHYCSGSSVSMEPCRTLSTKTEQRPEYHPPVQVVQAVVTRAPDLRRRLLILHRAVQMSAHRRQRFPLRLRRPDQQRRLVAELHDLAGVGFQVVHLARHHLIHRGLRHMGRIHEPDHGIKKGSLAKWRLHRSAAKTQMTSAESCPRSGWGNP